MLEKNSKPVFYTLLIPLYFLVFVCLIGMSIGSIEWLDASVSAVSIIIAAWCLSRYNSLIINAIGLTIFAAMGGNLIYSTLNRTFRTGPWTFNIYIGIILILIGLITFIYDVIKLVGKRK